MAVMHALTKLAEWLLGIPQAEPGQGTAWRRVTNFPWPSWVLLLFCVGALALVVWIYRRDAGHLSARPGISSLRWRPWRSFVYAFGTTLSIDGPAPLRRRLLDNSGQHGTEDLYRIGSQEGRCGAWRKPGSTNQRDSIWEVAALKNNGGNSAAGRKPQARCTHWPGETLLGLSAYLQPGQIDELLPQLRAVTVQGDRARLGDALRRAQQPAGAPSKRSC